MSLIEIGVQIFEVQKWYRESKRCPLCLRIRVLISELLIREVLRILKQEPIDYSNMYSYTISLFSCMCLSSARESRASQATGAKKG